jgi:hypothetical protein
VFVPLNPFQSSLVFAGKTRGQFNKTFLRLDYAQISVTSVKILSNYAPISVSYAKKSFIILTPGAYPRTEHLKVLVYLGRLRP